jgi:hypothetical protein
MKDFSSTDPDRTLVDPPDLELEDFKFGRSSKRSSRSSRHIDYSEDITDSENITDLPASNRKQKTKISIVTPVPKRTLEPPQPRKRSVAKPRAEILWRGYGCPKKTRVPECTSSDGYHDFTGKGTNQYATQYTCKNCHFSCSESRR